MKIPRTHRWDVTPKKAIQIQRDLANRVIERDQTGDVRLVGGVDVGFEGEGNRIARAAIVVLSFPTLKPVQYTIARMPVQYPYIPGLLSFREVPIVLHALKQLKSMPDIFLVDGHGRAHPRRIGIASHLGVLLDWPTIGCAKSILCGNVEEPANQAGTWSPLMDGATRIGAAVRTREGTKPIYVSIGHRVSLERAIDIVLKCCTRYRLPETTRWAHRVAGGEAIDLNSVKKSPA